jgi:hypothetical protein
MPRPQFTLRALLVAMLVMALAVWGYVQLRRSAQFTSAENDAKMKAEQLRQTAILYSGLADADRFPFPEARNASEAYRLARNLRAAAPSYDRLAAKYRKAARHPWLSVEEDGPEPQWRR